MKHFWAAYVLFTITSVARAQIPATIVSQIHNAPGWLPDHTYLSTRTLPHVRVNSGPGWMPSIARGSPIVHWQHISSCLMANARAGPQNPQARAPALRTAPARGDTCRGPTISQSPAGRTIICHGSRHGILTKTSQYRERRWQRTARSERMGAPAPLRPLKQAARFRMDVHGAF